MKILVYDDNPDFGGHQVMACHGIEALAAESPVEVLYMVNPANRKLTGRLGGIKNIRTLEADPAQFPSLVPDCILCIQGDIAQSSAGIQAALKTGIECISYIAIPHRMADMGAKLGRLRDLKNTPLLNRPDRYITISESMKTLLQERGVKKEISVVPNGILCPPERYKPPNGPHYTIGLIGRIEFNQKQQDFFVRTFLQHPEAFSNCRVLFVGSGPDEQKLKKLIEDNEALSLLPWQENMESVYEQLNLLVIPSRFEGVPLVMLEALARGIPVIGSRRDGMRDVLPQEWTFDAENAAALAATFSNVRKNGPDRIEELQSRIITDHSMEAFKQNFVKAVTPSEGTTSVSS
ncbi:glycosyltransferase family 4 protein [Pontiellaceae bacterium B12227]|nr:glycosyltransferase family 4 protein [Pontiellaceae bacterium B12227]